MKRIALIAGVSIATLMCAGPAAQAAPYSADSWWSNSRTAAPAEEPARPKITKPRQPAEKANVKGPRTADKTPAPPSGPLHIVDSIAKQRATLFDNGVLVYLPAGTSMA